MVDMPLVLTFLMGIANFALHRAVLSSGHPSVRSIQWVSRRGRGVTLAVEFVLLVAAMGFAHSGSIAALGAYAVYTVANAFAAWLILSNRL